MGKQTGGEVVQKRVVVIPAHEHWLHEPAMKNKLDRADYWMRNNPAEKSNLDVLEEKLKFHNRQ